LKKYETEGRKIISMILHSLTKLLSSQQEKRAEEETIYAPTQNKSSDGMQELVSSLYAEI